MGRHTLVTGIYLYGNWHGQACSACAPIGTPHDAILDFANSHLPPARSPWKIVDIATVRPGPSSPQPCSQAPFIRNHWFLVSE